MWLNSHKIIFLRECCNVFSFDYRDLLYKKIYGSNGIIIMKDFTIIP